MPVFEIKGPDGKTYEVEGADPQGALGALQTMLGGAPAAQPDLTNPKAPMEMGPPSPDTYRRETVSKELDAGPKSDGSYAQRLVRGMTMGGLDEIMAVGMTPLEMLKRGTMSPVEGYNWAKERENQIAERERKSQGLAGTLTETAGGFASGLSLAGAGLTFAPKAANAGLAARASGLAADGAVYGAATGTLEGDGLAGRLERGAIGAVVGGALGGAIPVAGAALSNAAAPVTSNISAMINPQRFAERKVAEAAVSSGRDPAGLAQALAQAKGEGQGAYTLADAMGTEGRNLLYSAAGSPGAGREMATAALAGRNVDAPRRLQGFLQEASGTNQTAEQLRAGMQSARQAEAAANYGPVKMDATAFDPSAAVGLANDAISPAASSFAKAQGAVPTNLSIRQGVEQGESAIRDPIREAVKEARSYLAAPNLTTMSVEKAFRAKTNIDQMIADATAKGRGGVVQELAPIAQALDDQLAKTSKTYDTARTQYAARSGEIDAIDAGVKAAKSGRMENTIPAFQAMKPGEQAGHRGGYFDTLIQRLQSGTQGPTTDATRALRSPSLDAEIPAFAVPGMGDVTSRRIGREAEMAATNARVLGGSRTAENMANDKGSMIDPGLVMSLLRGNFAQAAQVGLQKASNVAGGRTAPVRENMARLLLSGEDVAPLIAKSVTEREKRGAMIEILLRGGMGAGAVGLQGQRNQVKK